ncbi:hypothetical protein THAOC_11246, partial [Thalassiosira oceanica]
SLHRVLRLNPEQFPDVFLFLISYALVTHIFVLDTSVMHSKFTFTVSGYYGSGCNPAKERIRKPYSAPTVALHLPHDEFDFHLGGTRSLSSTLGDMPKKLVDLNIFVHRSSICQSRALARGWALVTVIAEVARPGTSELAYLGNPGQDDVGCGEVQYWWETSRLEVKFEKGTDNEQRARLSDAPLALRSDDLRVAAKAVAVDVCCGEVRSWCAVVMVDELGEEWTDEKLCRVTENVPTKLARLLGTGRRACGAAAKFGGQNNDPKIPVNTSCVRQAKPTPRVCRAIARAEEDVGEDWDGVTVLQDNNDKQPLRMPDYIGKTIVREGDINKVLKWINANRTEDRVNAKASTENMGQPVVMIAATSNQLELATLLLQLGANVNTKEFQGITTIFHTIVHPKLSTEDVNKLVRLLLSWGANFFSERLSSRENCVDMARQRGALKLADLLESELGGRRCEIVNLSSRPELNGKTCVADEHLPSSNQYKVTLETKDKEVVVLCPDNLKRRDRTPQDCGYYVEFKNGRTIRHDFDSNEDCQAFVAALNRDETQPAVTEEAEARAEQAAAELLAELGLDDIREESSCGQVKKAKKRRGDKKKRKN